MNQWEEEKMKERKGKKKIEIINERKDPEKEK